MKEEKQSMVEKGAGGGCPAWPDVERALDELLDLPKEARSGRVAAHAADDPALAREIESLLPFLEPSGPLEDGLEKGADRLLRGVEDEWVKARTEQHRDLGPYRLGELIAVGGMGRVYRARRVDGLFDREVAVKLLRWELSSDSLAERFDAERRILARLDHPAIARLLDGGVTDDHVPYLVMGLIEGMPIDRYCAERDIDPVGIVRLLLPVVEAIAYAHRLLIVHRDLKPANVLVDEAGSARLVDFGIAKLLDSSLADGLTHDGATPYTPAYASPEQLAGEPVDTTTDVYSLGCLLYQLLTGRPPFSPVATGMADPRLEGRVPAPPSSVVKARRTALWRDLDAIVLNALHPDRGRRYSGAVALLDDLRALLEGRPVEAAAPTAIYRTAKFLRRHALASSLAVLAVVALLGGSVATWVQAHAARAERDEARRLADFSLEILRQGDPGRSGSPRLLARDLLEGAAKRAASIGEPGSRAAILAVIGEGLANLQVHGPAVEHLLAAARDLGYPQTRDDPRLAEILGVAAEASAAEGELERGLELNAEARRFVLEDESTDSEAATRLAYQRAFLLARYTPETSVRRAEVVELLDEVIQVERARTPAGSEGLARALHLRGAQELASNRVASENSPERVERGLDWMREAAAIRRGLGEADAGALGLVDSLNDLALALDRLGRTEEGLEVMLEAVEVCEARINPAHPRALMVGQNLAAFYRDLGDLVEAGRRYRQVIGAWEAAGLEVQAQPLYGLASVLQQQGQAEEALSWARRAVAAVPSHEPSYPIVATLLGEVLVELGLVEEAEPLLSEVAARAVEVFGPDSEHSKRARAALREAQPER